jgi:hypothetical protein
LEEGYDWTLACWFDPGGAQALAEALGNLMEATLLSALSQPAHLGDRLQRRYRSMTLILFYPIEGDLEAALGQLGFKRQPYNPDHYKARLASLRPQALRQAVRLPEAPHSVWVAPVSQPGDSHGQKLWQTQSMLQRRLGQQLWGQEPGQPSRALAKLMEGSLGAHVAPDLEGVSTMEMFVLQREGAGVRWTPPLLFQGLCDLVGIALQAQHKARVEWAVCEATPSGLYAPPLLRVTPAQGAARPALLPIGKLLLRRAVMPSPQVYRPSLSQWLRQWLRQPR